MEEYQLTKREFKECIDRILQELSCQATTAENPVCVFVVGQPGAGKTGLSAMARRELKEQGEDFIEINTDKIAMYHKYYNELLNLLPEEYYQMTRQFVKPAMEIIYPELLKRKFNMVTESTFADTPKYKQMVSQRINSGYKIHIDAMAVDRLESILSCYEREVKMMECGLKPRGMDIPNHDRGYYGMLTTISMIEQEGLYNNIGIYTRGQEEIFPNSVCNPSSSFTDMIREERKRQHESLLFNPEKYIDRIQRIQKQVTLYGINQTLVNDTMANLKYIENEFTKQIEKRDDRGGECRTWNKII